MDEAHKFALRVGRTKGAGKKNLPHKSSLLVRETLEKHGIDLVERYMEILSELTEPEDKLMYLSKLFPYVYPKLSHLEVKKSPLEQELDQLTPEQLLAKAKEVFDAEFTKKEPSE